MILWSSVTYHPGHVRRRHRFLPANGAERGQNGESLGLMHDEIGGYRPGDIEVVAAFDIDRRKVGGQLVDAIAAPPNNTKRFYYMSAYK